ncbi:MAG TPA: copper ion binding protein, partial [Dehalococcoidia bacterium]|nr:copper ion binding protein [Dehalococcoidia bacterium]
MNEKVNSEKLKKAIIHVTGMTCSTCAVTVEKGLSETSGVKQAFVNLANEKATLEYDPAKTDLTKIRGIVSGLGYGVATRKSIFPVRGMMCATCVAHVEEALKGVPGVVSANVNLASEKATVEYVEGTSIQELKRAVEDAGYELGSESETLEDVTVASQRETDRLRNRFVFSVIIAAVIMVIMYVPALMKLAVTPYIMWALATPVQFWAGARFYRGMWGALKHRAADMNTLIAVGTSVAYFYSMIALLFPRLFQGVPGQVNLYFDTSAAIIALILFGRFLEARTKGRTSEAIKRLIGLQPKTATVIRDSQEVQIHVDEVQVGD